MIPSVHYFSLFLANLIQSTYKTHFNIILSTKLKSFIYSLFFRLLTKLLSVFLISPIYSTSNTHLSLLISVVLTELRKDNITHKFNYTVFSSLSSLPLFILCRIFLHSPFTFFLSYKRPLFISEQNSK
jgi:hypothetical protein